VLKNGSVAARMIRCMLPPLRRDRAIVARRGARPADGRLA
jgi:hypothetical protein